MHGTPVGLILSPRDLTNVFHPTVDKKKRLRKNIQVVGQRDSFGFEYGPVHILASNENGNKLAPKEARSGPRALQIGTGPKDRLGNSSESNLMK